MAEQRETVRIREPEGAEVDAFARCATDGPKVSPCWMLDALLKRELRREQQRVYVGPMVARDHDRHREGVCIDLGARSLWFVRFCPFCGVDITTTFPPEVAPHA